MAEFVCLRIVCGDIVLQEAVTTVAPAVMPATPRLSADEISALVDTHVRQAFEAMTSVVTQQVETVATGT